MPSPSERWTICRMGHVHWGAIGGAGILFRYAGQGVPTTYLLAQRSRWVDQGGTWGMPGGAIRSGETPQDAARREVNEEIGTVPLYRATEVDVQDCGGGWTFRIFDAEVEEEFMAYCGRETDATGWFTAEMMKVLPLHPGVRRWLEKGCGLGP